MPNESPDETENTKQMHQFSFAKSNQYLASSTSMPLKEARLQGSNRMLDNDYNDSTNFKLGNIFMANTPEKSSQGHRASQAKAK